MRNSKFPPNFSFGKVKRASKIQNLKFIYSILFLLILLFIFLLEGKTYLRETGVSQKILRFNLTIARPIFGFKNKIGFLEDETKGYFQTKNRLSYDNQILKDENLKLKTKALKAEILEKENSGLLNLLGRKSEKVFLIASVSYRPPMTDFDTFIIDAGQKIGIQKGMKVMAYGDILLGEVDEVLNSMSKVKLYSYSGSQINVLLTQPDYVSDFVVAVGRGGENFEITLAKDAPVDIGDKILTSDLPPFIIGEVQKIIKNENAPFQKIYFRYPFNLNELRYVYVLR